MIHFESRRRSRHFSPLTGTGDFPDPVNPVARADNGQQVNVDLNFNDLERRKSVLRRILNLECSPGLGSPDPIAELSDLAAEAGTRVH